MAMGMPLRHEDKSPNEPLPWLMLEMVVAEKKVSWDWLLTGRRHRGADGDDTALMERPAQPDPEPERARPPRIETRELTRALLSTTSEPPSLEEPESTAAQHDTLEDNIDVVRELESIKASMRKELERVEHILKRHGKSN